MRPDIVLGTVQWGMRYGIANRLGQPEVSEVARIVCLAEANGICSLDTARDYGDSERVIGEVVGDGWQIVTKLTHDLGSDGASGVRASLERSLQELRRAHVDVILLHRPDQRNVAGVWTCLKDLQSRGRVGKLGISATTPTDAMAALEDDEIEHIQVATSVLDQRLARSGFFERAKERGKSVHIRSAFLQGVAFLEAHEIPTHLACLGPEIAKIDAFARGWSVSRHAVFLQYLCGLPVDGVILGCESSEQLEQNLNWFADNVDAAALGELANAISMCEESVLDPNQWMSG